MQVPADPYPFHHHQRMQVRFNDLDALGHVNNSIYLEYCDFGKVEYITEVLQGAFNMERESLVIVNINSEFYEITRFGEPIEVLTRIDDIGAHTIVFVQRIINPETGHVKVIDRTVMVGYNIPDNCKMAIPDLWRQRVEAYEGRQWTLNQTTALS